MHWWDSEIQKIATDSIHGATYLTYESIELVKKANKEELSQILPPLKAAQPYMASIYNFCRFIDKNRELFTPQLCDEWWRKFQEYDEEIIKKSANLLRDKRVLTHSHSSLVRKTLLQANPKEIICTESRPKCEGRELAYILQDSGVDVKLIIDAAVGLLIKKVDVIIFGADGLGEFGLVHKVGSYLMALAAKEARIPVVALVNPFKIWPKDFTLPPQPHKPADEIDGKIEAINLYFDVTPLNFINKIIS
ncbi:hypothetical protein [Nitratiruptor sp. YY09-18]|uniref:hypothetical protein n=1 Tax=Nitratiruptor sp. YY09-18 TaxID=2724901 RepID=UPI00191546EE|nr:hypothetical protein [Nitratiruptor sp. YY09-18]BCD68428.1 translation initiation factor eIF-2B subunit delta [Nitratiruptor sp. YY09-18]